MGGGKRPAVTSPSAARRRRAEHPKTTIQIIRSGGAHAGLLGGFIANLDSMKRPPQA